MTGNRQKVTEETYIRMMPFSVIKYMSLLLDIDNKWNRLVVEIPRSLNDIGNREAERRYSHIQIRVFESKLKHSDGSPTRSILDDWGTQNTKVKHLLTVLQMSALYEAADYLSVNVLHGEKVPRLSASGQNVNHLPQPTWNDQKKAPKETKVPEELKKDSLNFNNNAEKPVYQNDKNACFSNSESDSLNDACSGEDHTYNSLLKDRNDDRPYNDLTQDSTEPSSPLSYHRITSFDSGGNISELLKNENAQNVTRGGQEHEETVQVRPMRSSFECMKLSQSPVKENALKASSLSKPSRPGPEGISANEREPQENSDDLASISSPMESIYVRTGSKQMEYDYLAELTDNFNRNPTIKGGRVIGTGGFGEVFLGVFKNGFKVAVKRLKDNDEVDKQFISELDNLVKYHHKNIVRLYAYSIDGLGKCLVYEYLCNGSLEDRLMKKDDTPPLKNTLRLSILKGTAEGIQFLNSNGVVHRDLKSANVLLDENFEPKVGDFATARTGPQGNKTTAMQTQVVIGTVAYLAPEALHFDVSTKLDSYSFGIVILEVLTGLPAMDEGREERDIKSHVEESDIEDVLDEQGGVWSEDVVKILLQISEKCTEYKKKKRVNIGDIIAELSSLSC